MEESAAILDFHPCLEPPPPSWVDSSFNFQTLTSPNHHIPAHHHQHASIDFGLEGSEPTILPHAYTVLTAPTLGTVDLYPIHSLPSSFPVIVDSGASLAVSPSEHDFVGPINYYASERRLGGMAGGMKIKGVGRIAWSFKTPTGVLTVHSKCYFVPSAKARLMSPQQLFSEADGINGSLTCKEKLASLTFDSIGTLDIPYDPNNHLPIALAKNLSGAQAQVNLTVLNEANQNLTPAQKLLLLWHFKFGHKGFGFIQCILRFAPFGSDRFKAAAKCSPP
jgi:hypothetical protein